MASATIDVILRYVEIGKASLEKTLKEIQKIPIGVDISGLEKSLDSTTNAVKEGIGEVEERIEDVADKTGILVKKRGETILATAAGMTETFASRAILLISSTIGSIAVTAKFFMSSAYRNSGSFLLFVRDEALLVLYDVAGQIKGIWGYLTKTYHIVSAFVSEAFKARDIIWNLWQAMKQVFQASAFFFLSRMIMKEALGFFQKIIGLGKETITPIERISRIVVTIDTTMNTVTQKFGAIFKFVAFLGLNFFAPFSGIITKLATLNVFTEMITRFMTLPRLRLASLFGSARSQFALVFTEVKNGLEKLTSVGILRTFIGGGKSAMEKIFEKVKVFANMDFSKLFSFFSKIPSLLREILQALERIGVVSKATIQGVLAGFQPQVMKIWQYTKSFFSYLSGAFSSLWAGAKNLIAIPTRIFSLFRKPADAEKKPLAEEKIKSVPKIDEGKIKEWAEKVSRQYVVALLNSLNTSLSKTTLDKDARIAKAFETFFGSIGKKVKVFPDREMLKGQVKTLESAINASMQTLNLSKSGNLGEKFATTITESNKKSEPQVKNALNGFFKNIFSGVEVAPATFLGKLKLQGSRIIEQVQQGIWLGRVKLNPVLVRLTSLIRSFFPASPAKLGALKDLIRGGTLIPIQIAQGIEKGMDNLINAVEKISEAVLKHFKPVLELGRLSIRTGVAVDDLAKLEYALSDVEVKASDLQYVFASMKKALSETTEEQYKAFADIGIRLEDYAGKQNAIMLLWEEVSDRIAKLPTDSEKAQKALEAIGVSAGMNTMLAFRKTKEEIQKAKVEAGKMGITVEAEFLKGIEVLNKIWGRIKEIAKYVSNDFLKEVLPVLNELSIGLFQFIKEKRESIQSFLSFAGKSLRAFYEVVRETIFLLISDPEKGITIALNMLYFFGKAVISSIFALFERFKDAIWNSLSAVLGFVSAVIMEWIDLLFGKILVKMKASISNTFREFRSEFVFLQQKYLPRQLQLFDFAEEVQGLKKAKEGTEAEIQGMENSFSRTVKNLEGITKVSFSEIGKTVSKGFSKDEIGKGIEEVSQEFSQMFQSIKKEAEGTKIEEKIKNLESLIYGTSQNSKKEVENSLDAILEEFGMTGSSAEKKVNETAKNIVNTAKETADNFVASITRVKTELDKKIKNLEIDISLKSPGESTYQETAEKERLERKKKFQDDLLELHKMGKTKEELREYQRKQDQILGEMEVKQKEDRERNLAKKLRDIRKETLSESKDPFDFSAIREKYQEEIESLMEKQKESIEELNKLGATISEIEQAKANYASAIKKKQQESDEAIVTSTMTFMGATFGGLTDTLGKAIELTGNKYKELFYAHKAMAVAQSIINTSLGVTQAIAQGGIAGIITGAIVAAKGAMETAIILAQEYNPPTELATGGIIQSGTTPTADDVPALLSKGEAVLPARIVEFYGKEKIQGLIQGEIPKNFYTEKIIPKFSVGGFVGENATQGNNASSQMQKNQASPNIVNIVDPSLLQQYLNTSQGRNAIFNIISNNSARFRTALSV